MLMRDKQLEEVMGQLGGFGRYQLQQHVLHLLGAFLAGVHMFALNFIAPTPAHRCYVPEIDSDALLPGGASFAPTFNESTLSRYIPYKKDGDLDSCRRYVAPLPQNGTDFNFGGSGGAGLTVSCGGHFVYDQSTYFESRVYDWDMVCEQKWMRAFIQTIYVFGVLNGAFFGGALSDKYGRKLIFYVSAVLQLFFALVNPHITSYPLYCTCLFFYGVFGSGGAYVTGFVLSMELIEKSKRTLCGTLFSVAYAVGVMVVAGWSYFIRDILLLQTILALHCLLLVGHWWLIDESIVWLWGQGRFQEAMAIVRKAVKQNGKEFVEKVDNRKLSAGKILQADTAEVPPTSYGLSDLFRTPNLRFRSIIVSFHWFAIALCFYGLAFNSGGLHGNPYFVFFLTGASDLPGHLLVILLVDRTGRRALNSIFLLIGGAACIAMVFIPKGLIVTTIAMFAKIAMAGCFAVIYNYTAELFPTVVRNSAVGLCSLAARFGGMLTPQITLLDSLDKSIPTIVFGSMALIAAFVGLFLPETLGKDMPQTLEEGENFGRGDTAFGGCIKGKSSKGATKDKKYAHEVDLEADRAAIKPLTYKINNGNNLSNGTTTGE